MPRKQTRRSISVSGPTYERLKAYCESTSQSMSGVTERLLLGDLGKPVDRVKLIKKAEKKIEPVNGDNGGNIFTF